MSLIESLLVFEYERVIMCHWAKHDNTFVFDAYFHKMKGKNYV